MFDRIEFIRQWRGFRPGDTTDILTGGQADVLFRQGFARPAVVAATPVAVAVLTVLASDSEADKPTTPGKIRRRS